MAEGGVVEGSRMPSAVSKWFCNIAHKRSAQLEIAERMAQMRINKHSRTNIPVSLQRET